MLADMMLAEDAINERFERVHRACHKCGAGMTDQDDGWWLCERCGEAVRDHVSWSALRLHHRCPQAFYLKYLQEAVEPALPLRQSVGGQWHQWQHKYATACRENDRERDFDAARTLMAPYSDRVRELATEFMYNFSYDPEGWRGRGGTEIYRRVPLGDELPDFVCYIDLLEHNAYDNRLTVTDFKTPPARAYKDLDYPPPQVLWYAWAAYETEKDLADVQEVEMVRWIVPDSVRQSWTMYPPFTGTEKQVVRLTERALQAENYPTTPSVEACTYCPFYHECDAAQEYELTAPKCPDEAATLVEKVNALRDQVSNLVGAVSHRQVLKDARKILEWIDRLSDTAREQRDLDEQERKAIIEAAEAFRARANRIQALVQDWVFNVGPIAVGASAYGYHYPKWHEEGRVQAEPGDIEAFARACREENLNPLDFVKQWDKGTLGKTFADYLTDPEDRPTGDVTESPFGDAEETVQQKSAVADTLEKVKPSRTWGRRKIQAKNPWNDEGETDEANDGEPAWADALKSQQPTTAEDDDK